MTWNYRVIKKEEGYGIHEVFYGKKGKPHSWTTEPLDPYGETQQELFENWTMMGEAFTKPVLEVKGKKLIEITEEINETNKGGADTVLRDDYFHDEGGLGGKVQ